MDNSDDDEVRYHTTSPTMDQDDFDEPTIPVFPCLFLTCIVIRIHSYSTVSSKIVVKTLFPSVNAGK